MKRKGFTLIELLAVIVVLAIIALIATPIVMNTIKKSKKGAAERSADSFVKQVETTVETERLSGNIIEDGEYEITSDGNLCKDKSANCSDENKIKIEMNGTKPDSGRIKINNGQVTTDSTMIIGEYDVSYDDELKKYIAVKLETYSIKYNLTNVVGDSNNVTNITTKNVKILKFTANSGYSLPDSVTVNGATYTWDKNMGNLVLSKVTGDVTVIISGIEKLCKATTSPTTGNIPSGNFDYGDEYICNLGEADNNKNLIFFVLDKTDTEVSLILNSSIGTAKDNVAKDALETQIADWNKITKNKVTLPTYNQIYKASGNKTTGLPTWLFKNNYSMNTSYYWLSESCSNGGTYAVYGYSGYISCLHSSSAESIRPVITISKSELW